MNQKPLYSKSSKTLFAATQKERDKLAKQIDTHTNNEVPKETFSEKYKPAEIRPRQFDERLPGREVEIKVRTLRLLSGDNIMQEAQKLFAQWENTALADKRVIQLLFYLFALFYCL